MNSRHKLKVSFSVQSGADTWGGTVPYKILSGGDGGAFVPQKISEIFKYKFLVSPTVFTGFCVVFIVQSCNITWEIVYYFFFSSDIENT